MGYKTWRTLSVCVALSAFAVGCTNGPQKTTNGLGSNGAIKQQQPVQAFPNATDRNAQINQFGQKSPNLPPMTPPSNPNPLQGGLNSQQPAGFNQPVINQPVINQPTGFNQSRSINNQPAGLPEFQPLPQNNGSGGVGFNSPAAPTFGDQRVQPPVNLTPGPGFPGGR